MSRNGSESCLKEGQADGFALESAGRQGMGRDPDVFSTVGRERDRVLERLGQAGQLLGQLTRCH